MLPCGLNRDMFKLFHSHRWLLGWYSGRVLEDCTGFKGDSFRKTHLWEHSVRTNKNALITCLKHLNVSATSRHVSRVGVNYCKFLQGGLARTQGRRPSQRGTKNWEISTTTTSQRARRAPSTPTAKRKCWKKASKTIRRAPSTPTAKKGNAGKLAKP